MERISGKAYGLLAVGLAALFVGVLVQTVGRDYLFGGVSEFGTLNSDYTRSNVSTKHTKLPLKFTDSEGRSFDLDKLKGKPVVLTIMRGFNGFVCPQCSGQTSRLITNAGEFDRRGAAVVIVYPGPKDAIELYIKQSRLEAKDKPFPFPILLDTEGQVTEQLGIKADLARPSTYVLDRNGKIVYAYVGSSTADRPPIKTMLEQLDKAAAVPVEKPFEKTDANPVDDPNPSAAK